MLRLGETLLGSHSSCGGLAFASTVCTVATCKAQACVPAVAAPFRRLSACRARPAKVVFNRCNANLPPMEEPPKPIDASPAGAREELPSEAAALGLSLTPEEIARLAETLDPSILELLALC